MGFPVECGCGETAKGRVYCKDHELAPCASCGKPCGFTVDWMAPRRDAKYADVPSCSFRCASAYMDKVEGRAVRV
jgi:hypothetical protein